MENWRWSIQSVFSGMVTKMLQTDNDIATDLHFYAAQAQTAAAAAHRRRRHEAADELSIKAHDYSMAASERSSEIVKQVHVPMRA
jgi:hypothetical protein